MKKINWSKLKEQIVHALKFIIFATAMIMGFWLVYAFIWIAVGLPETAWALWLLYGLAILTECLYVKWVSN